MRPALKPRRLSKDELRWRAVHGDAGLKESIKEILGRYGRDVDPSDNTVAHYQTPRAIHVVLAKEGKLGPLAAYKGDKQQRVHLAVLMKYMGQRRELLSARRLIDGYEWDVYQAPPVKPKPASEAPEEIRKVLSCLLEAQAAYFKLDEELWKLLEPMLADPEVRKAAMSWLPECPARFRTYLLTKEP